MTRWELITSDELLEEPWISLKNRLPPANVEVEWYDAMFDKVMVFALADPAMHDGDFSHWKPVPRRPKEWDEAWEGKQKDSYLVFYGNPFVKCPKCVTKQTATAFITTGKRYCMGCGELLEKQPHNE